MDGRYFARNPGPANLPALGFFLNAGRFAGPTGAANAGDFWTVLAYGANTVWIVISDFL